VAERQLPKLNELSVHFAIFVDLLDLTVQNGLEADSTPTNTHSERVNILKYVKVAGKWRFAPVAKRANGSIRWDHVLISGADEHHPEGKYYIEWRDLDRERKSVGSVPSEVMSEAQRKRAYLDAKAAGLNVVSQDERPQRRQRLALARAFREPADDKKDSSLACCARNSGRGSYHSGLAAL
jgi:hypothetical protein